jgi:hypothetical protein
MSSGGILLLLKTVDSYTLHPWLNLVESESLLRGGFAMRNILVAVAGLVVLFAIWQLGLFWLGPFAGTGPADVEELIPCLKKLSQIQEKDNMPETEVDRIMAGFPSSVEEIRGDGAVAASMFEGKTAFLKVYDCKLPKSKGHFLIHVYFDEEHRVVGTASTMKDQKGHQHRD